MQINIRRGNRCPYDARCVSLRLMCGAFTNYIYCCKLNNRDENGVK